MNLMMLLTIILIVTAGSADIPPSSSQSYAETTCSPLFNGVIHWLALVSGCNLGIFIVVVCSVSTLVISTKQPLAFELKVKMQVRHNSEIFC